jgi:riboflavin biosynthesis pyrimidine reductase
VTRYEQLLPPGPPVPAADALAGVDFAARAGDELPYTFCNFVTTLDGRAALDGRTKALGGPADLEMLLALRAVADAVLVGPGTVRAESYGRLLRRPAAPPPAVLISRRFEVPWDAGLFAAADQHVLVYAPFGEPPAVAAQVEVVHLPDCTPAAVLADLRARGVRALLCEGGPTLFHALLAAGLVDELFLTLTASVTGDDGQPRIVTGPRFPAPLEFELKWVLRAGSELFLRYAR